MGNALVTNNAVGTLASSINNSTTVVTLNSGQGALFPNPGAGQYFFITVYNDANTKEIMKVTARSVNTLTVVRAQDGTSAAAWNSGDRVELRPIAALHNNYAQKDSANTFADDQTITGDLTVETVNADDLVTQVVDISKAAGQVRPINWRSGADLRASLYMTSEAEDGSNAGSNMQLDVYANDGSTVIAAAMKVARKTGIMTVLAGFLIGSNKADAFPAGTKIVFAQASPPTGWTQDTSRNDRVLRVVNTAGDGTGGSWTISGLSVSGHVLTTAELPEHSHLLATTNSGGSSLQSPTDTLTYDGTFGDNPRYRLTRDTVEPTIGRTGKVGSGAAHSHELSIGSSWRPSYQDVIVASKN